MWSHSAEGFLATDLDDKSDDRYAATATKYNHPCSRNTFVASRTENDKYDSSDNVLHYGQIFRLSTVTDLAEPVAYLHTMPKTPTVCSKYSRNQEVSFCPRPTSYTLWKVLHIDPSIRLETDGQPVPCNAALVLTHVNTNNLLAATNHIYRNDFSAEHGDQEVCAKTFQAASKLAFGRRDAVYEGVENHFVFATRRAEGESSKSTTDEKMPEVVSLFFDGTPMSTKADKIAALFADDFEISFVGPYTGATTGMKLGKQDALGAIGNLVSCFPDFTFNNANAVPSKNDVGGWGASITVHGTHTGAPYTPMPDVLPPMEPKGTDCTIGPELFTMYTNDEGKATKLTIEPLHEGALAGPPGFYVLVGGKLPSE